MVGVAVGLQPIGSVRRCQSRPATAVSPDFGSGLLGALVGCVGACEDASGSAGRTEFTFRCEVQAVTISRSGTRATGP
jgi:hypothetical protein